MRSIMSSLQLQSLFKIWYRNSNLKLKMCVSGKESSGASIGEQENSLQLTLKGCDVSMYTHTQNKRIVINLLLRTSKPKLSSSSGNSSITYRSERSPYVNTSTSNNVPLCTVIRNNVLTLVNSTLFLLLTIRLLTGLRDCVFVVMDP
jgi:hypothetical protein